jgi:hypothetical protein
VGGRLHGKEDLAGSTPVDGSIFPPVGEERGCARGERPVFQTVPGESDSRHPLRFISANALDAGGPVAGLLNRLLKFDSSRGRLFSSSDRIVGTSLRSSLARFDSWRRGRRDGATVARRAHTPMPFGRVGSTPTPATAARLGDGRASYARARGFDSLRSDPCQHPFTVGWSEIFSECSPVEGRLSRVQEAGGSIPLTPTTCRTSKLVNAPVLQTAVAGFDPLVLHHVVCF